MHQCATHVNENYKNFVRQAFWGFEGNNIPIKISIVYGM